ncbi:alpha/beta hydrolase family protein [Halapricum desulfuricans]|uniref:Dipeptidyl aminopeptidase/acylaminoacyl-peptidase n=1 Tax=Halapricum desulfuricans TaxID=2841257 RepID=A0A897N3K7_9EURY|nr:S9 family peptidase [Halapricum desulfuricans]QSG07287.1 Dipeptidyl aminopeptidase/acylaminoacyl-peptidase [Halapricum desulfuricans]
MSPQFDLERYLNVRSAYGASLAVDGTLAFLMDTTGTAQVWTLEESGGWPRQRTFGEESVGFVSWSPERHELAFSRDEGGNERAQLFRLAPDSGEVHALTDVPEAKHRWGGWSHDGDRVAFTSNRRDERVFDVYVQGRTESGGDADLVYEGDGWLSLGGWDPDDERLLVVESHSSFDQDLYALDVDTGKLTHLSPHEGAVRHQSAGWGPDGESIYLVTDRDSDTLYLARLDVETGAVETVVGGGEWNVDGVALDQESGRLAYSRNVEGYTELTVGELDGPTDVRTYPELDLPGGLAGGVAWSDDADRFALTATGRTENANVHVVDLETRREPGGATGTASERWTRASTAGIPRESFRKPELIHYETFDGREIPALFSLPEQPVAGETPVIVDVHGGPESQRRPSFSGLTQYFLSRGYAVLEPNVRGSTGYGKAYTHLDDVEKRMDSVRDLRAGADWLADHGLIDPDRIAVKGGSYGGFMVLAAMTEYPELWAAGVDVVGIANFVTFLKNTGSWRRELREAEYGSLADDREFLESISPVNRVDRIEAPLFVVHGENDPRVPVGEAEQIVAALRDRDVPVELRIYDDEGHGLSKRTNQIDAYTDVVAFLDEHV